MKKEVPEHIAIIMDGNGRWAKKRFLPRVVGHRQGAQALDKLLIDAEGLGVKHITVYAFSTENWKRSQEEVIGLMGLLREYIKDFIKRNNTSRLKVNVIGDLSALEQDIQDDIKVLEEISKNKPGINIHIALNYGGRDEITRGVKEIVKKALSGDIKLDEIDEDMIANHLDTKNIPDPELLIRTSGEYRLSNFLPWQLAYSEFYFTDKLWPDFNVNDLKDAIAYYQGRDRRFGGRNEVK